MQPSTPFDTDHFYFKKLKDIHFKAIRLCPGDWPVWKAALYMSEMRVSCLFVGDNPNQIEGFVTDLTLRERVLAIQKSGDILVSEIIDRKLVSITVEAPLYEALLLMFKTKSRYLLLKEEGRFVGYVSRTKILSEPHSDPFLFIQSVKQAEHIGELTEKWQMMPRQINELVDRGLKAQVINQIVTTVSDTIALRVIESVVYEIGPPPAKFVFFVLGSEGRGEQTLKTDQDNAIIYEDKANEHRELVRAYFLEFANRLSSHLDTIGFTFCKGGYMAKNPKWTHSLSHWKNNYESWIQDSSQETVMKYASFFDCRALYGEASLLTELKSFMNQQLDHATERFWVNMGQNALQFEAPLTIFRKNIRTEKIDGEEKFNIKKAMTPVVDLARIFALKYRIWETNTGMRIQELAKKGVLTDKEEKELLYAYYFLMGLRLESQAKAITEEGKEPVNYIATGKLTKVQVSTLIEIFKIIKEFQLKIKLEFTKNIF